MKIDLIKTTRKKILGTLCTTALSLSMLYAAPGAATVNGDTVTLTIKDGLEATIGTHSNVVDTSIGTIDFQDGPSFSAAPHLQSIGGANLNVEVDFQPAQNSLNDGRVVITYSGGLANDTIGVHSLIFSDMQWTDYSPPIGANTEVYFVGAIQDDFNLYGNLYDNYLNSQVDNGDAAFFTGGYSILNLKFQDIENDGLVFRLNNQGNGGFIIEYTATHIPEPSTYLLLGSMLFGAAAAKSRRRKVA